MKNLPERLILAKPPKEYLVQGLSHCGAYSVKAILSFYNKDDGRIPEKYHPRKLGRILGATYGQYYWADILKRYGVNVEAGRVSNLNNQEKLDLLRGYLSNGSPIMISIGNGYLPKGKYNRLRSFFVGHWITLWGYDDIKQVFYVYDSATLKDDYDRNIPIGNKTRTYSEILRDWETPVASRLLLLLSPQGSFYIAPSNRIDSFPQQVQKASV